MTTTTGTQRVRREPPRFRRVEVRTVEPRTPRLTRVVLGGPELVGMAVPDPAASVRLLLPSTAATGGTPALVLPVWNGNEFRLPDGDRPVLRTFTPWRTREDDDELAIDVVDHGAGAVSEWATRAAPGMPVALSGPGRGSAPPPGGDDHLLVGDESAMPAIEQVLATLPAAATVRVIVELQHDDARLAALDGAGCEWRIRVPGDRPGDSLVAAVRDANLTDATRVWAAGEAAAMQRIRRHLFEERGVARARTVVRGYWKTGTTGDGAGDGAGDSDAASE